MTDPDNKWISAAEALAMLTQTSMLPRNAAKTICRRAHVGLVHARAVHLIIDIHESSNVPVPPDFWWAEGEAALAQNWVAGDFETWIKQKVRMQAFGVTFQRADIEAIVPARIVPADPPLPPSPPAPAKTSGGRPPAAYWDDLWVEIARQLYSGDLQPKRQSDIEKAMSDWLAAQGHHPSESTLRDRARRLWTAINRDDEK